MSFDDWWIPLEEVAGEARQASWLANFTIGRYRAAGGKLELTAHRLVFRPSRVDRALGAKVWSVPLDAITALGKMPRTWNLFDGGLRTRLRVTTRDGAAHLFVVNGLDRVIAAIADAMAQARGPGA